MGFTCLPVICTTCFFVFQRNITDTMAELRLLKEAIVCSSEALANNAQALPSQLIGRLYPYLMDPHISRLDVICIISNNYYSYI